MNKQLLFTFARWVIPAMLPITGYSQVTLGRQVVSCLGLSGQNGEIALSATAGQNGYTTENSGELILTQGFQQPINQSLLIDYDLTQPSCSNGLTWTFDINSVQGCGAGQTYTVLLENNAVALPLSGSGNDTLVVEISAGTNCAALLSIPIYYPQEACFLVFPDVISPNGDQYNEYWHIEGIELPEFSTNELKIINRWGQLVWQGRNYDNEIVVFRGIDSRNNLLPDGTYFYEFRVGDNAYEGYIELMR